MVVAGVLAGCTSGASGDERSLQVLAAASLTEVFTDLGEEFEAAHDGVDVEFSFGSSTDLAEQAADGAPGDVLATADEAAMTVAADAGAAVGPAIFATNTLVIATAPGNPAGIESLADLAGTTWVRCADEVPCGRAAVALLEDAGVPAEPASLEEDVRATLDKVTSGEADAALVYATDAVSAGGSVDAIEIEGADAARNAYAVAPLAQAADADLARAWIDLVTGPEGRAALAGAGFGQP
ncbi:molybdate ABC transporter substrate-binding protein [Myceligenerans crystallogenes]|uniref:Molybdate ABC transporter substrate-binding protein n=1 Tax=Myceligenerans crystallogenes TaxID=316335 RepID=A0ABN2NGG8_9MICO